MNGLSKRIAAVAAVLLVTLPVHAQKPLLSIFKENYFISGVPLNTAPAYNTSDAKYQVSVRFNAVRDLAGSGWDLFWGYTQLSVWDVYRPSNPFRENTYMNGLYAAWDDRILAGYEHRSNGRDGTDSRSLDYGFISYTQPVGEHFAVQATGRFGIGSIGNDFSLEMFSRYQGYANITLGYRGSGDRLDAKLSVTPLFPSGFRDISANVTGEVNYRLLKATDWFYLTAQYHYGYDEAQIDSATPGVFLKRMFRIGLSVQPQSFMQRLFF